MAAICLIGKGTLSTLRLFLTSPSRGFVRGAERQFVRLEKALCRHYGYFLPPLCVVFLRGAERPEQLK